MDNNVIRCVSGIVTEIPTPFKATIQFKHRKTGNVEIALLKREKFIHDGHFCGAEDFTLSAVLKVGSHVCFTAHGFDPVNPPPWSDDGHGWYIISAWCEEDEAQMLVRYMPGLVNETVKVASLGSKRQGTLNYEDHNGVTHKILFLGSKVFLYGHRLNTKQMLDTQLHFDDMLFCDAIPCDTEQNDAGCSWFATAVWRGFKPHNLDGDAKIVPSTPEALLRVTRSITNNAKAVFVRGRGQVMSVLSEEFGLALMQLRHNQWSSVLFHRSACFLRGLSLSKLSLHNSLKEGDPVRMVCVSSQDMHPFKFVACQLSIDVEGENLESLHEWPPLPSAQPPSPYQQ